MMMKRMNHSLIVKKEKYVPMKHALLLCCVNSVSDRVGFIFTLRQKIDFWIQ